MGRVARYKKVKSIDPFAKNNTWTSDQGDKSTLRRIKRKSKTALRLQEQKLRQRRGKKGAGSNGRHDDDGGYDLPPEGGDEFDLKDLMGSVKKQRNKLVDAMLLEPQVLASAMPSVAPSGSLKEHQVGQQGKKKKSNNEKDDTKKGGKKKQQKQPVTTPDGDLIITHKTPTNEIIAAHSNPKRKRETTSSTTAVNTNEEDAGPSKQERRKAYLQEKKLKKKRGAATSTTNDSDNEEDMLAAHRLQHQAQSEGQSSSSSTTTKQPKKHITQQENYSDTIVARSIIDDQVERPPTFSVLPRGANKLSKNQAKKNKAASSSSGGDNEQRIRKEQQALEAMRERVMRQYSALREKRRSGGV